VTDPATNLPAKIPLPSPGQELVVARVLGAGVDLAVDDHSISRKPHLRLRRETSGQLYAEDLSSDGRLRIEGVPLRSGLLEDGQWLRIGTVPYQRVGEQLELRIDEDGVAVELVGATVNVATPGGLRRLLDRLSFRLEPNEFIGIIGPSGAGKSTLLRVLAGEQPVSAGHAVLQDHRGPLEPRAHAASLGYVPQEDALHEQLSVRQSLDYAARIRLAGRPQEEQQRAVEKTLRMLDLEEVAEQRIGNELSGGQRKRVNVGHELLSRPRLLCLDEPSSGLDPFLEGELMSSLRGIARQGCSVVCTTHVMGSLHIFDRLIVLAEGGRLAWIGPPEDMKEAFGIKREVALYPLLMGNNAQAYAPDHAARPSEAPRSLRAAPRRQGGLLGQLPPLLGRGLRLTLFDPRAMLTTLALPLIIGLGIRLALPDLVDRDAALFFGIIGVLWLGLQGACLELVRERNVFLRERRTGLSVFAYLGSKLAVLGFVGLIQVAVITLLFHLDFKQEALAGLPTRFLDGFLGGRRAGLDLFPPLILLATNFLGLSFGLLISAGAASERRAGLLVPMLVIPMILFSAKGMAVSDSLGFLAARGPELPREWVAALNPARHGYELAYAALRSGVPPGFGDAGLEYLSLLGLPWLAIGLCIWLLKRAGTREAVPVGEIEIPDLDRAEASDAERAAALVAAGSFAANPRCPRCGLRVSLEEDCRRCHLRPVSAAAGALLRPAGAAITELWTGALCLPRGLFLLARSRELRALSIVPLLVNLGFLVAAWKLGSGLRDWLTALSPEALTEWTGPLWGRLRFVLIAAAPFAGRLSSLFIPLCAALLFGLVGKYPLMPFLELLAEKAVDVKLKDALEEPFSLLRIGKNMARGLVDTVLVTAIQLFITILLLPLAWLPLLGPLLWFALPPAFGAAIDYLDLNLVVRHYGPWEKARIFWARRWRLAGFGLAFVLPLSLPWINLVLGPLLLPTAAVGGAILFLELDRK